MKTRVPYSGKRTKGEVSSSLGERPEYNEGGKPQGEYLKREIPEALFRSLSIDKNFEGISQCVRGRRADTSYERADRNVRTGAA